MSIVTYENVDTPVFDIDFLRYLFANGESGLLLSYLPDHLYADVDKTVPATIGGGIASFDDLSGNGVTGPQSVSTARPIFRASPARGEYDSADDVLPKDVTLPAITGGTVVLIGQQGIWIDEGYSFAGGNWSLGPTTYPNGPTGIIGVVGDMLDLVVLDRPLTPQERQKVIQAGLRRGSAGLIEPGPELVVNTGGPFTESSPFYLSGNMPNTSLDVVDGNLVMSSSGAFPAHAMQTVPGGLPVSLYLTELGIVSSNAVGQVRVGVTPSGNPSGITSNLILASGEAHLGKTRVVRSNVIVGTALAIGGRDDVKSLIISSISIRRLIMPGETP